MSKRTGYAASDVSAIVVSHDSGAVLRKCMLSLAAEHISAILVDNASSDDSVAFGRNCGARVLPNSRNEGFGRAMNAGMRAVEIPFALLVNPDITPHPGAIERLLEAAER